MRKSLLVAANLAIAMRILSKTKMLKSRLLLATLLSASVSLTAPPNQNLGVTSTLQGLGFGTVPKYDLQGDQMGPYLNGVGGISSIIGQGDWILSANGALTRRILFSFTDPIPGSRPGGADPAPPFTYALLDGRFICKAHNYDVDFDGMYGVGSTINSPMHASFQYNGYTHRIDMDGVVFGPGSQPALVTCLRVNASTNRCNQWRVNLQARSKPTV